MLYLDQVQKVVQNSTHPMTAKTIAKRLNLKRKVVIASLLRLNRFHDKNIVKFSGYKMGKFVQSDRPQWFYEHDAVIV